MQFYFGDKYFNLGTVYYYTKPAIIVIFKNYNNRCL